MTRTASHQGDERPPSRAAASSSSVTQRVRRGAAVVAVTGVGGPDGAVAVIELAPSLDGLAHRYDGRGRLGVTPARSSKASTIGLVLERHPLGPAVGDERSADELGGLREEHAEHDGRSVGVERLDRLDDRRRRRGEDVEDGMQADHCVGVVSGHVDDRDGRLGLRPGAQALGGHDQDVGRAEVTQRGDVRRPRRGRSADDDHPPPADQCTERSPPPIHLRRLGSGALAILWGFHRQKRC